MYTWMYTGIYTSYKRLRENGEKNHYQYAMFSTRLTDFLTDVSTEAPYTYGEARKLLTRPKKNSAPMGDGWEGALMQKPRSQMKILSKLRKFFLAHEETNFQQTFKNLHIMSAESGYDNIANQNGK